MKRLHKQQLHKQCFTWNTSRPPAPAGIGACETTPQKDNNRAAEGVRAAVVREVAADGAGGGSGV